MSRITNLIKLILAFCVVTLAFGEEWELAKGKKGSPIKSTSPSSLSVLTTGATSAIGGASLADGSFIYASSNNLISRTASGTVATCLASLTDAPAGQLAYSANYVYWAEVDATTSASTVKRSLVSVGSVLSGTSPKTYVYGSPSCGAAAAYGTQFNLDIGALNLPVTGLAVSPGTTPNVFASIAADYTIQVFDPTGAGSTRVYGLSGSDDIPSTTGTACNAQAFTAPSQLAVYGSNLYVADTDTVFSWITRIDLSVLNCRVTALVGAGIGIFRIVGHTGATTHIPGTGAAVTSLNCMAPAIAFQGAYLYVYDQYGLSTISTGGTGVTTVLSSQLVTGGSLTCGAADGVTLTQGGTAGTLFLTGTAANTISKITWTTTSVKTKVKVDPKTGAVKGGKGKGKL